MELLQPILSSDGFDAIVSAAEKGKNSAVFGAHTVHRELFAAALSERLDRSILMVFSSDSDAAKACADLVGASVDAVVYPSRDFILLDVAGSSHDAEVSRLSVLGSLADGDRTVVCAPIEAICQHTMPLEIYRENSFLLRQGDIIEMKSLMSKLVASGYTRLDKVEGAGCFAQRGGIVDLFPVGRSEPVRIEFFGNEIDSISPFDPLTQRRSAPVHAISVTPAREVSLGQPDRATEILESLLKKSKSETFSKLVSRDIDLIKGGSIPDNCDRYLPYCYPESATLLDYMKDAVVMLCEPNAIKERASSLAAMRFDELSALAAQGYILDECSAYFSDFDVDWRSFPTVYTDFFVRSIDAKLSELININANVVPRFTLELTSLTEELNGYVGSGFSITLLASTDKAKSTLMRDLVSAGFSVIDIDREPPRSGCIAIGVGSLSSGAVFPQAKYVIMSENRTSEKKNPPRHDKAPDRKAFGSLEDLHVGDYIVHKNHGIGIFEGIQRVDHHGLVRDYIKIQYKGSDTLYVPVTQLDMVSEYVAPHDDGKVQIARLHSGDWQKTKQAVYRSVREMAKELIELYAQREKAAGIAFEDIGDWQDDFEDRFIYEETEDQLRAVRDIREDMLAQKPMDRLLCGDVGVGKTEVALRAAFRCVTNSYQCAVLVPTTILAWQHLGTFSERMSAYPIKIAMLSRFSTPKEIKEAVAGIKNGTVDIAIGTHRLLQKDIQFKKLGLLIVDEEQRFGVSHKEKLKQKFNNIDVLTLSATPIPRTLNMAMSGLRDMSVIETPPFDRYPVQTYVMEYDDGVIGDAIKRELARGGQVYYLHNRVETIDSCAERIRRLAPDATVEVAHGQMSEEQLSDVWRRLSAGEVDVLVCTTIIETGVDVANCNTLIIENADHLGLAQLYQIRGRVGRSSRRAYAYFTFRKDRILTEVATKRLSAIRDFTSFGSGFKIAMRDLQIRGAGSVLSARQSGHIQAVGYDTYVDILEQAVNDEKGIPPKPERVECLVDLPIDAYIPEKYIPDSESRIEMYKKIAAIETPENADDIHNELRDRFGKAPACVNGLVTVSLLRARGGEAGLYEISQKEGAILLYGDNLDEASVRKAIKEAPGRAMYSAKGKSYIAVDSRYGEPTDTVFAIINTLADCRTEKAKAAAKAAADSTAE